MWASLVARRRAAPVNAVPTRGDAPGVYVSASDLAALEGAARHLVFRPRHPAHNLLAGRRASRVRGRGLDFDELRQYQPGDDARTIDWRVTARMSQPFVRTYTEEKDRPVTLIVDQRINMFFGTRFAMKSVTAAETAALCAWRALMDGDRLAGVVFDDAAVHHHRLDRNRGALLRLLGRIAASNTALHAAATVQRNRAQLDIALELTARTASHDHLVILISDGDGRSPHTRDSLRRIAMRNDVVVFLIVDPFLADLPASRDLVVTDGELQVELPLGRGRTRRSLVEAADRRLTDILQWHHDLAVTVVPISTAEGAATQLRHLIGTQRAKAGRGPT
jgi:uncharacterized protein (DUF58 family)